MARQPGRVHRDEGAEVAGQPIPARATSSIVTTGPPEPRHGYGFDDTDGGYGVAHVRGPQSGKERSDERVEELVCEALHDDGGVDATNITVSAHDGEVTLAGTVETRRMKQLAEGCAQRVGGVTAVVNQIKVRRQRAELALFEQRGRDELAVDVDVGARHRRRREPRFELLANRAPGQLAEHADRRDRIVEIVGDEPVTPSSTSSAAQWYATTGVPHANASSIATGSASRRASSSRGHRAAARRARCRRARRDSARSASSSAARSRA